MYTSTTQIGPETFDGAVVYRMGQPTGDGTGLPGKAGKNFAPPKDAKKPKKGAKKSEKKGKK
jgi:hypothetical protein